MAIPLRDFRRLQPIQTQKREVPVDQIIRVLGKSPAAEGMRITGEKVGQALQTTGELIGGVLERKAQLRRQGEQLAQAETALGVPPGTLGKDLEVPQALKAYELRLKKEQPDSGGYFIPRGLDPGTNRPVYSHSKKPGLFYDDMTPFAGAPGALTLQKLPSEQITKEEQFSNVLSAVKKINASYKPSYVGMGQAPLGKALQYFDVTASPMRAVFYGNLQDLKNQIVYLRSGKQINENEEKRLSRALPSEYKSDIDFAAKFNNFLDVFDDIMRTRGLAFKSSGYRLPATGVRFGPELRLPERGKSSGGWTPEKEARYQELIKIKQGGK